ncbi:MAG: hypothetical protein IBX49_10720 [Gammaproteobacteria bacterium]|nr:hypothetical protein [Gammaproteobacteria bacterium]
MGFKRHNLVLQAVTPIAHQDTVTGVDNSSNIRLFMRQQMLVNNIPARVPAISENALRSVIFRNPLHDHLFQFLGIQSGELPQSVMNLMYSGGNMAAGSKAPADEIALGHAVKKLYPALDLLGGAVDGFILPRSRLRLAAWIVADEYADLIQLINPELALEAREAGSCFDLVQEETRTRGTGGESDGNQMLYTYETLAAGTKLLVELTFDPHTPDVTLGAAALALQEWDGYLGGQSRQGRGRVGILQNELPAADAYMTHLAENKDTMKAGLLDGTLGTGKTLCK